jgi:sugar phosphate isomerase/epimerase
MEVGVFTVILGMNGVPLGDSLDYVKSKGIDWVEIGTGNYPGQSHCPLEELLSNKKALADWQDEFKRRKIRISGLSCHGNPLHPNKEIAKAHTEVQRKTIELAEKIGVKVVVLFSGCPGGSPKDTMPNWVTCPWPPDFLEILDYQWNDVVIPYWTQEAKFARDHGIKLAFEAHPGFVVYNPETVLKLRKACGNTIGANLDPSHFFWQGIDPIAAARELKGAIHYVHAKDTRVDPINTSRNGTLDVKSYGDVIERSWVFRTCGYGHDELWWNTFVSTLKLCGYDHVLSIEHEDSLMTPREGLEKAIEFLQRVVVREKAGRATWF